MIKITSCKAITLVRSLYLLYLMSNEPMPPSLMLSPSTMVIISQEMAKFCRSISNTWSALPTMITSYNVCQLLYPSVLQSSYSCLSMFSITAKKEVVKKGTIPKMSSDNFNSLPSLVSRVKMKIKPVRVRYLHFTMNCAMLLKNGITDAYAKNNVMMMEYNIAWSVSTRLTSILSSNNFVPSSLPKAVCYLAGLWYQTI